MHLIIWCLVILLLGIPQLQSAPNLDPGVNSIIVSWAPTQFSPDGYSVSQSCQLICGSALTQLTDTVNGISTTHMLFAAPGSRCSVSIVAIFNPNYTSNAITSSTITLSAGIGQHSCTIDTWAQLSTLYISPQPLLALLEDSLARQWRAGHWV